MEAMLVDRPELDGADLYLFYDTGDKRHPIDVEDGRLIRKQQPVEAGAELPRTLHLPRQAIDALRATLIGEALQRDDSLADARHVRDRLLTMVESEWESRQIERTP